jgi:hypothetical protein
VSVSGADGKSTASIDGSFTTAPAATAWQDVRFAIMSCQTHKDRDDVDGMHIYPAMTTQNVNFYVATGDNVYYDSDTPLATTVEMARFHWHRMYALPWLVEFHRTTPGYWEKDDHDCYRNDGWPPQGANADRSGDLVGELNFHKGLKIFASKTRSARRRIAPSAGARAASLVHRGRVFVRRTTCPAPRQDDLGPRADGGSEHLATTRLGVVSPTPIVG